MIKHNNNGLRYYTFENFPANRVDHGLYTRLGGQSQGPYQALNLGGTVGDRPEDVLANHQRLFESFGRPFESRFDVWQVHGKTMITADQPRPQNQKHQPADGIFTDNPEVTLLMRFADCVPLVYYDPIKRIVGLVHAGWQGTLQQVAAEGVRLLQEKYNSNPKDVIVGIGPSICGECYQVREDVYQQFLSEFGQDAEGFFTRRESGLYLDLWAANIYTLKQAGVRQIENADQCTAEHVDEWYSYRKEKGVTGRFGVVIALKA